MSRFGDLSSNAIDESIQNTEPHNTVKTKKYVWKQFLTFCSERNYVLNESISTEMIASILKDWAFNMRKCNGENYKENVVKTMWNITAKQVQEKYMKEFNRVIDPFSSPIFLAARNARNSKRRELQMLPDKRKVSASAFKDNEYIAMIEAWDENTPEGLQIKFFLIASVELAWRGNEGASCLTHYFQKETGNDDTPTGRIQYNPIFTKTTQGGAKPCANNKWLVPNHNEVSRCPVRLLDKLMMKRSENINIKTDRLFLTVNPNWRKEKTLGWYKNMPIGVHEISKWTKKSAELANLNMTNKIFSNHSHRATAVSQLAKAGVSEQELIKITGHGNSNSIKPYLQIDEQHHQNIINKMRSNFKNAAGSSNNTSSISSTSMSSGHVSCAENNSVKKNVVYNNCNFHCTNLYLN